MASRKVEIVISLLLCLFVTFAVLVLVCTEENRVVEWNYGIDAGHNLTIAIDEEQSYLVATIWLQMLSHDGPDVVVTVGLEGLYNDTSKIIQQMVSTASADEEVTNTEYFSISEAQDFTSYRWVISTDSEAPFGITFSYAMTNSGEWYLFFAALILLLIFSVLFCIQVPDMRVLAVSFAVIGVAAVSYFEGPPSLIKVLSWIDHDAIFIIGSTSIVVAVLEMSEVLPRASDCAFKPDRCAVIILVTSGASLLMENVTVMMLFVPQIIRTCRSEGFDPKPVVISALMLANIAGTASPLGDQPNSLITADEEIYDTVGRGRFFLLSIIGVSLAYFCGVVVLGWFYQRANVNGRANANADEYSDSVRAANAAFEAMLNTVFVAGLSGRDNGAEQEATLQTDAVDNFLAWIQHHLIQGVPPKDALQPISAELLQESAKKADHDLLAALAASVADSAIQAVEALEQVTDDANALRKAWVDAENLRTLMSYETLFERMKTLGDNLDVIITGSQARGHLDVVASDELEKAVQQIEEAMTPVSEWAPVVGNALRTLQTAMTDAHELASELENDLENVAPQDAYSALTKVVTITTILNDYKLTVDKDWTNKLQRPLTESDQAVDDALSKVEPTMALATTALDQLKIRVAGIIAARCTSATAAIQRYRPDIQAGNDALLEELVKEAVVAVVNEIALRDVERIHRELLAYLVVTQRARGEFLAHHVAARAIDRTAAGVGDDAGKLCVEAASRAAAAASKAAAAAGSSPDGLAADYQLKAADYQQKVKKVLNHLRIRFPDDGPDAVLALVSGSALALMILLYGLRAIFRWDVTMGFIAFYFAIILILLIPILRDECRMDKLLENVEWGTLLFFVGLSIFINSLQELHFMEKIGSWISSCVSSVPPEFQLFVAVPLIIVLPGLVSMLMDSVPVAAVMIPVIKEIAEDCDLPLCILAVALSMGVCFGGNGTIVAATSNIVTVAVAKTHGCDISAIYFVKRGFFVAILSLFAALVYMEIVAFAYSVFFL